MTTCMAYITTKDADEARRIAKALIEERLAACANILGPIQSLYWWDGAVRDEGEVAMIVKTRRDLMDRLIERVRALHSYTCPCIVALPIEGGNSPFLDWIVSETSPPEPDAFRSNREAIRPKS